MDLGIALLAHAFRSRQVFDIESLVDPAQKDLPLKITWNE